MSQMEEEVVWLSELCLLIKGLTNMVVRAPWEVFLMKLGAIGLGK